MADYDTGKISSFNSGMFIITRIHNLKERLNEAYLSGNLMGVNNILDRFYLELIDEKLNPDEIIEINKWNNFISKSYKKRNTLSFFLKKKEECLRKIEFRQGKGTKYKDANEDIFDIWPKLMLMVLNIQ